MKKLLLIVLTFSISLDAMEMIKEGGKSELLCLKVVEKHHFEEAMHTLRSHIVEDLQAEPDRVGTIRYEISEELDAACVNKEIKKTLLNLLIYPKELGLYTEGNQSKINEYRKSCQEKINSCNVGNSKEFILEHFDSLFAHYEECLRNYTQACTLLAHEKHNALKQLTEKVTMCLEGAAGPQFFLISREMMQKIANIDEKGNKVGASGMGQQHQTYRSSSGRVYFKCTQAVDPAHPEYETAVYALYSILFPTIQVISPCCTLVIKDMNGETHYFQANTAIDGETLTKKIKDNDLSSIDHESFSALVLGSFLINPDDWKPENLIMRKNGQIVGIDNDKVFAPPIVQDKHGFHLVGVKNIAYFLREHMAKKVHPAIVDCIHNANPQIIIEEWLTFLQERQRIYDKIKKYAYPINCDPENDADKGIAKPNTPPALVIKFEPRLIEELLNSFKQLKALLRSDSTHQYLFERMQELVSLYYAKMGAGHQPSVAYSKIAKEAPALEKILDLNAPTQDGRKIFKVLSGENNTMYYSAKRTQKIDDALHHFKFGTLPAILKPHDGLIEDKTEAHVAWEEIRNRLFKEKKSDEQDKECIVSWPPLKKRFVSFDHHTQLWDDQGKFKPKNRCSNPKNCKDSSCVHWGRREVSWVEIEGKKIWFKRFPNVAGYEHAVSSLIKTVLGYGFTSNEIIWIQNECYGISLDTAGENLQDIFNGTPEGTNPDCLSKLDPKEISETILMTMLLAPEDGKPDNFNIQKIGEKKRLVCIDNENSFFPTYITNKENSKLIRAVKSIIFCLDQMKDSVHEEARKNFLKKEPLDVLTQWLRKCNGYHNSVQDAYDHSMLEICKKNSCYIGIPFASGMLTRLYKKYRVLCDALQRDPQITHLNLLLEVYPGLLEYKAAFEKKQTVYKRFMTVDEPLFGKKNGHLFSLFTDGVLESQNIPFETVADAIRAGKEQTPGSALIELNGIRKTAEAHDSCDLVAKIQKKYPLFSKNMETIEKEKWLESINFGEKKESRDFSTETEQKKLFENESFKNTQWNELIIKNACYFTPEQFKALTISNLTKLNLSGCKKITDASIELLHGCAFLEKLNLSRLGALTRISKGKGFFSAPLQLPNLFELNVSNCPSLQEINTDTPQLMLLFAKECSTLKKINTLSRLLKVLDLEKSPQLSNEEFEKIFQSSPSLKNVFLQGCDLIKRTEMTDEDPHYPIKVVDALPPVLGECIKNNFKKTKSLAIIDLSAVQKIADADFNQLCNALKATPLGNYIKELYLGGDNVSNRAIESLAELLKCNTTLEILNLGYGQESETKEQMSDKIKKISNALTYNKTLRTFSFLK